MEFALTCHVFYRLAHAPVLEHQDYMRHATTISTLDQSRDYLASREVRQLQDSRLAEYTHCLKVVGEKSQLLFDNVSRTLDETTIQ